MNTQPASSPTFPGAPRRFGFNPFVAVVGAALLLGGFVAYGLYARNSGDSVAPAVPGVVMPAPVPARAVFNAVDRPGRTYFVVASAEQATAVKAGLTEAEAMRYALGEPPLLESVYVADSAADAAAFDAAVVEGNMTLVALGLSEERVVDLRDD
jgi:hypothetical protein